MAHVTITVTRADRIGELPAIFAEVAIPRITALTAKGASTVQQRSPVDRGVFRAGIANRVQIVESVQVIGSVFSQADSVVVNVIEEGRAPGTFPRLDAIRGWVARKLSPLPKLFNSVVYRVGRKIKERGIPGKHVFANSNEALQPDIARAADEIAAEISARL